MLSALGIRLEATSAVTVTVSLAALPSVVLPLTVKFVLTVAAPVRASVLPSKVKLELSSSSPLVPASTTRPEVKSPIAAV